MGRATALRLAAEGHAVVVSDLDAGPLDALVGEIEAGGGRALARRADLTSREACHTLVRDALEWGGGLGALVACAGTLAGSGPFLAVDPAAWRLSLDVNASAFFHLSQAALPGMIAAGGGSLVAIASVAGLGAVPLMAPYHASKFALVGLVKALAAEFGTQGIRVNAVCPGMVDTDMAREEFALLAEAAGTTPAEVEAALAAETALGRSASADEIAAVASFLCSPASSYVTGVALPVAGGLSVGL